MKITHIIVAATAAVAIGACGGTAATAPTSTTRRVAVAPASTEVPVTASATTTTVPPQVYGYVQMGCPDGRTVRITLNGPTGDGILPFKPAGMYSFDRGRTWRAGPVGTDAAASDCTHS